MQIEISEQDINDILGGLDLAVKAGGLSVAARLVPAAGRLVAAAKASANSQEAPPDN